MEKNKSIDGLSSRRAKKPTNSTTATKKPVAKKSTAKPIAQKKTIKVTKPVKIPVQEKSVQLKEEKPTPIAPEKFEPATNITEDFLKPTQVFDFDEQSGELKAAQDPTESKSTKKSKKQKKPMSKKRKIITWVALIIVLLLIGGAIWLILWGNDIIAKITGGQGTVFDLFVESYEPLKTDENGRTNILAFGTSGFDMSGEEYGGVHDGAQLTDSIMVISLDQATGDVAMLSLPRDLKASPTCTATGKINEVYWCNNMDGENEQAGAEALMTEVGDILGIDFQYYAHLNWGSLESIVDTIGGINIILDEDINDYYYTGSVYEAGTEYAINGIQAVALSRARHGTTSGDFSRGASQQKILIGIKDKVLEKGLSITDLLGLASTLGDNLRTNFSIDEMKTLAHLASNFDFNNMRQISLIEPEPLVTTGTINGISYVLPSAGVGNYNAIQKYITKMFSSDPRSYEDYTILILNATETPGLASTEKSTLEEAGYDNIYIDDAPAGEYPEGYTVYSLTDTAPGTKKLLEEKYQTTTKSTAELPAGIPTDYNFIIIVNSDNSN